MTLTRWHNPWNSLHTRQRELRDIVIAELVDHFGVVMRQVAEWLKAGPVFVVIPGIAKSMTEKRYEINFGLPDMVWGAMR